VVNANAMATNSFAFRTIDLYSVKVEELTFSVPFELVAERDDYIHAFVCYFDIEFTACHKVVRFGSGPQDPYTHWKQVNFYLLDCFLFAQAFGCESGRSDQRYLFIIS
jgi:type I protein arginine methyltransferase